MEIGHSVKVTLTSVQTISGLILGQGAVLNIADGGSLTVGTAINNVGVIQLNSTGADPTLAIKGVVSMDGGGTLVMEGPTADNQILGVPGTGAVLDNVDVTIFGTGTIGAGPGALTLINEFGGTLEALGGTLQIFPGGRKFRPHRCRGRQHLAADRRHH